MYFYQVAVNYPIKNKGLTYGFSEKLEPGQIVKVPLGKREDLGCVLGESSGDIDREKIKDIKSVLSQKLLGPELKLYQLISEYYHYSLGQLIFDSLPNTMKRPRGLPIIMGRGHDLNFELNQDQTKTVESILENFNGFHKHLLHGVTGSGKTAVYLQLMKQTIKAGKSVLFLLPEINLTPQFLTFFEEFLPVPIYTYHSEVSDSYKFQLFQLARDQESPVVVMGVRSSVFVPIKNLGLILIDEEHDTSFKQDDRCPYNARDVGMMKAQIHQIPIVMGSATPSLESYQNFKKDETHYHPISKRAGDAYLPEIKILNAREKKDGSEDIWPFTEDSLKRIKFHLQEKNQVLVYVNRLGFSNFLQCRACGKQFHCPNCSVTLRYFKKRNRLSCHHCDYHEPVPAACQSCGSFTLLPKGYGTEKVEEVLRALYPEARLARFDRDEIQNFTQLENRLREFKEEKVDIMVGTQMLSKGHNFEKVKLVVILGIDHQLNFPDFRAQERVYQALTQVSGRAGRYSKDGEVIIQTLNPEAMIFDYVKKHSFDQFYLDELKLREMCHCPPFKRLASLHFTSRFQDKLQSHVIESVSPMLEQIREKYFSDIQLLGPRPAMVEKKVNQFTWTFLLKSDRPAELNKLLKSFELNYQKPSFIQLKIDVDPYNMM